jgi:hypothetical protein
VYAQKTLAREGGVRYLASAVACVCVCVCVCVYTHIYIHICVCFGELGMHLASAVAFVLVSTGALVRATED